MAAEVMITDVIEIDCFGNSRHLVDIAQGSHTDSGNR